MFIIIFVESFGLIGKIFIVFGLIMLTVGAIIMFAGRIPWIGRLPGDIYIQKKNFTFYFPLTTSVIISVLISLLFWFLSRR